MGVAAAGNAYVGGVTDSTNFPTARPLQPALGGSDDAFVCKICNDPPPGTTPNTFATTGSLQTLRQGYTATLLPTGNVLIAGGFGLPPTFLASAELYDPVSGVFSYTTGAMATGRSNHTATLLPNGKVLIAGGRTDSSTVTTSAELYDPSSGTFTSTGSMGTARYIHTATRL